ncbi:hypothetical protein G9A89_013777 [Geosiphon pyriformis]|nr:hypothetical protein G9A89_013777 [Geosiphon pyriformis]
MKLHCLSTNPRTNCFLLKLRQLELLFDCGLDLSGLLKFAPLDTLGGVDEHGVTNIYNLASENSNANETLAERTSRHKRRKVEGIRVRQRGEIFVQTPDFSAVEWSSVDFILISNFKHMLALPFVTQYTEFNGKIFATEPTIELGRQLMKELVHYFGENLLCDAPKTRFFSKSKEKINFTEDKGPYNSRSLYTITDVNLCIEKIQPIRYGEHLMLFNSLKVTAYSSGFCLGGANWSIEYGYQKIALISSSSVGNNIHPAPFDKIVLENANAAVLSDINPEVNISYDHMINEIEHHAASALKRGNNVLFPCSLNGIIFDILKDLSDRLERMGLQIPFYIASPVAEESLQYSNILAEWMCAPNQEKVYIPEDPMEHKRLMSQGRLIHVARVDSSINEKYKEPCIVFSGHPSLRSGPVIDFIHKWGADANNLIIFTDSEFDRKSAMRAFEGMRIKFEYLPIDIRLSTYQVGQIIGLHKPQHVIISNDVIDSAAGTFPPIPLLTPYRYMDIINIPIKISFEKTLLTETLAKNIPLIKFGQSLLGSLQGKLLMHNNQLALEPEKDLVPSRLLWGSLRVDKILDRLSQIGIDDFNVVHDELTSDITITLHSPTAIIKLSDGKSIIEANNNRTRKILADILVAQFTKS